MGQDPVQRMIFTPAAHGRLAHLNASGRTLTPISFFIRFVGAEELLELMQTGSANNFGPPRFVAKFRPSNNKVCNSVNKERHVCQREPAVYTYPVPPPRSAGVKISAISDRGHSDDVEKKRAHLDLARNNQIRRYYMCPHFRTRDSTSQCWTQRKLLTFASTRA